MGISYDSKKHFRSMNALFCSSNHRMSVGRRNIRQCREVERATTSGTVELEEEQDESMVRE